MPTPVKFPELLDIKWVLEQLQIKSQAQLAKEIGCKRSSVAWVYTRYFSDEERSLVKFERQHKPK